MMPRKSPFFIRVAVREKSVICINPWQLVTFHVESAAKCRKLKAGAPARSENPDDYDVYEADVIRLHFVGNTSLRYEVGKDISAEEFNMVCALLWDWVYQTGMELEAKSEAEARSRMELWNKNNNGSE